MKFYETLARFGDIGELIRAECIESWNDGLLGIALAVNHEAAQIMDIIFKDILHKILNSDEYQARSILHAEVTAYKKMIDQITETENFLREENRRLKKENSELLAATKVL